MQKFSNKALEKNLCWEGAVLVRHARAGMIENYKINA